MAIKAPTKQTKHASLHELFIMKLQALYDIEIQLVKALPKKAKDLDLKKGFHEHFEQTIGHVERIEQAFDLLGEKPKKLKVEAIRGLVLDADWLMKNIKNPQALDAGLIAAAQYVEHYEMAGYESAIEWAKLMNHTEVEDLLTETLREEKEASEKLKDLATSKINEQADPALMSE